MNPSGVRRRLLTVTGVAGIGYALSWIAGLSVRRPARNSPPPEPRSLPRWPGTGPPWPRSTPSPRGACRRAGHRLDRLGPGGTQSGAGAATRVRPRAGVAAALISLLQFALGAVLAGTASPGTAHLLYDAVNRLDGVKMLALAILAWPPPRRGCCPAGGVHRDALAIAITASGVAYLLLLQNLAILAVPAGVLLLVFITGTGIALGTSAGKPRRDAPTERMIPMPTSHR